MSLVTVNKPREVVPLKASISAVNWPGMLAWINAPAPAMGTLKVSVTGPLPPLPESEVQIRLSPAVKPLPPVQLQLAGIGEHTTETMLLAPARVTVSLLPPAEFALKLAGRIVWSPPSCTQLIESLAPCPGWLVTWTSESAQAVPVASMIKTAKPLSRRRQKGFSIAVTVQASTHAAARRSAAARRAAGRAELPPTKRLDAICGWGPLRPEMIRGNTIPPAAAGCGIPASSSRPAGRAWRTPKTCRCRNNLRRTPTKVPGRRTKTRKPIPAVCR